MSEPIEVDGGESDFKCPTCSSVLVDLGDGCPEAGDVVECGCGIKVKVTSVDWSVYFVGEVVT